MSHIPARKFSDAICMKFRAHPQRHLATPANARWMLDKKRGRALSSSPLASLHIRELRAVAALSVRRKK